MSNANLTFENFQTQSKTVGLAFIGLHVAAFEAVVALAKKADAQIKTQGEKAKQNVEQYNQSATKLFEELVERGVVVEADLKENVGKINFTALNSLVNEANEKVKDLVEPITKKLSKD